MSKNLLTAAEGGRRFTQQIYSLLAAEGVIYSLVRRRRRRRKPTLFPILCLLTAAKGGGRFTHYIYPLVAAEVDHLLTYSPFTHLWEPKACIYSLYLLTPPKAGPRFTHHLLTYKNKINNTGQVP